IAVFEGRDELSALRGIRGKAMEEFREAPPRRVDAATPVDSGELFAVRGRGDFRGFGFGAVIAPQIIGIEGLEIFADGNNGGTGGVESDGENLIGGNAGLAEGGAGARARGAHV